MAPIDRASVARWLTILVSASSACSKGAAPARPEPGAHAAPSDAAPASTAAGDAGAAEHKLVCWLTPDPRCATDAGPRIC